MRAARLLAAAAAIVAVGAPAALAAPAPQGPKPGPAGCKVKPGTAGTGEIPWAQTRLQYDKVRPLATGKGQTVAVVDSGVNTDNPQTHPLRLTRPTNVLPTYQPTDVRDCGNEGHGTAVTAIIAAPSLDGIGFTGLAPDVTIMPIKEFDADTDKLSTSDTVAAGIRAAVAAKVDVINLSLYASEDTAGLQQAMDAAKSADIVVVASSGNTGGQGDQIGYPAAYGSKYPNLLAVGATDAHDNITNYSTTGPFLDVAAPGDQILAPTPLRGYSNQHSGTSFAAPFVSATAALVRERFPKLTAAQVVTRIEATADRPGVAVPDKGYGYGIVNPYVALTAVRDDNQVLPSTPAGRPVPPPVLAAPPDRHPQHVAYAVGGGLFGLAAVLAAGAVAVRRGMRAQRVAR